MLKSCQELDSAMARIGYARVSTNRQDEDSQVEQLKAAGCKQIFAEKASTRLAEESRSELQSALELLEDEDVLVVTKLDRLGRTQVEVINRLHTLQSEGKHLETLDGLINTKALGKMAPIFIGLLSGLAEVERELIRERTLDSIAYRRAIGGDLGGRRKSFNAWQPEQAKQLVEQGHSYRDIAKKLKLSKGVVARIVKAEPVAA